MKKTTKLALLAGALTASTLVMAIEQPKSWYLLPGINTMKADKDWQADDRLIGGSLKLGAEVGKNIDLQAGAGLARAEGTNNSYKQETLGIDALWLFSRSSLRPFLLAGLGAENDKIQTPTRKANSYAPYLNGGAGLQWSFDKDAFLQADLRYLVGVVDSKRWGQDYSRNLVGHVGVGFVFGNAPQKAVATATPVPTAAPKATATPAPTVAPTATPLPTSTPLPTATPTPVKPTEVPAPKFERVTLSASSLFAIGQSKLGADKTELSKIADVLKATPDIKQIQVSGYTDRLGSAKANQALSQRRADSVKAFLVAQGVAAERILAVGKGSSNPVSKCDNVKKKAELAACLAPDRRIELEPVTVQVKK